MKKRLDSLKVFSLGDGGSTLVEIIVALAITAILMAGVYGLYMAFFKKTSEQDLLIEAQQNARAGVNMIEKELVLAGYRVPDETPLGTPLTSMVLADGSEIEFRYIDPLTGGTRLKVTYEIRTSPQRLVRQVCEQDTEWDGCTDANFYTVIDNLDPAGDGGGLLFAYYDEDGTSISVPVSAANLPNIRFVKVTVTTKTRSALASTGATKSVITSTEVRLRNLYLVSGGGDVTEPAQPSGLEVREDSLGGRTTGICGRLRLRWTKGAEGDLAYYRIFYTLGTVEKNVKVSVSDFTDLGTEYEYTLAPGRDANGDWNLQHTPSDASSLKTYTIAIRAFDNSHNPSVLSAEISGNPTPSRGPDTFGSGSDDTTINPAKLPAVAGFMAADGASDGEVLLSWTAYDTSTNPDTDGFRVYRNTADFSSYPVTPGGSIKWIAAEEAGEGIQEKGPSATSLTDPGPSLIGCRVYYYVIAPVSCDATLVTDDTGSDPDAKKYVEANYTKTYGDGADEPETDSPSGSDTAPPDLTAPAVPAIEVRAGWKRVAVSLTQSAAVDLDQTCVHVNESAAYPAFLSSKDAYNCYEVDTDLTPDAQLVPDSGGVFTTVELPQAQSTAFWHDSMTQESPLTPSLLEEGTYSYGAVSFDLCGNGSDTSQAQDTTTLCGEDPDPPGALGYKPPAVTNLAAACCDDDATCCEGEPAGMTLSWTPVPSDLSQPSTDGNPYDLAGYRIFRSTTADFGASVMISGSAPYWGSSFQDATATDGNAYYYKIATTDCPYERNDPSAATIRSDMIADTLHSGMAGPVYPGRIQRDEKCEGVGSCTQDLHREILTGVTMGNDAGNGTGDSSITGVVVAGGVTTAVTAESYWHSKITVFFRNTQASAATLTIQGASISWVNEDAFLSAVTIGGGRGGIGETSTTISTAPTALTPTETDPYTRTLSNLDLDDKTIPGNVRYVPITFEFTDSSGNPIGMRADKLRLTLNVKNDFPAPGTTSCVSYLTISQSLEGINVPLGPSMTSARQDQPDDPTLGYAVPGITQNNLITPVAAADCDPTAPCVDGSAPVTISAVVASNTLNAQTQQKVDVTSVKLYYQATAKSVTVAPETGYTEVTMEDSLGAPCAIPGTSGSGTCLAQIPDQDGLRVWYYTVAIDEDGNFDRDPERADGAYVYDQKEFDVCDVAPGAPENLTLAKNVLDVTVDWDEVTTYSNGAGVQPGDTITYKVYRDGVLLAAGGCADPVAGTSCIDTVPGAGAYSYYVKAVNTCPNTGDASDAKSICAGGSSDTSIEVSANEIISGESFTVTVFDCLGLSLGHELHTDYINKAFSDISATPGSFTNTSARTSDVHAPEVTETAIDSGLFITTVTTGLAGAGANVDVNPMTGSSPPDAYTDRIDVSYIFGVPPPTVSVTVTPNPCDTTPSSPTNFRVVNTTGNFGIEIGWNAVTTNIAPFASVPTGPPNPSFPSYDLGGYYLEERVVSDGGALVQDWQAYDDGTGIVPAGTTTVSFNVNNGKLKDNVYSYRIRAIDTCSPAEESATAGPVNETVP